MHQDKYIDVEEVQAVADTVTRTGANVREAAAYAQEADPDWWMWGAVGAPLAYGYFEAVPHIQGILQGTAEAIEGLAKRIDTAALAVAACDEESMNRFNELGSELAGGI